MYLIENINIDRDSLNELIKAKTIKEFNDNFINNEEDYTSYNNDSIVYCNYRIVFYKYTTGGFLVDGSSYYLENKEHDGGPTSTNFLSNIYKDRIAKFRLKYCDNNKEKYYGIINYLSNGKYDTIIRKE